jgi:hypothetical protein
MKTERTDVVISLTSSERSNLHKKRRLASEIQGLNVIGVEGKEIKEFVHSGESAGHGFSDET